MRSADDLTQFMQRFVLLRWADAFEVEDALWVDGERSGPCVVDLWTIPAVGRDRQLSFRNWESAIAYFACYGAAIEDRLVETLSLRR